MTRPNTRRIIFSSVVEKEGPNIEDFVRAFDAAPNQVGAGFLIGGQVVGLEVFDNPTSFQAKMTGNLFQYSGLART
jgi:hypothetical protein